MRREQIVGPAVRVARSLKVLWSAFRLILAGTALLVAGWSGSVSLVDYRADVTAAPAEGWLEEGEYDRALAAVNAALELRPRDADLWRIRSQILSNIALFRQDDLAAAQAESSSRRAAKLNPLDAANHFELAWTLRALDRTPAAEAAYLNALTRDPHNTDYLYAFGHFLELDGRPVEAAALYRAALRVRPDPAIGRSLARVKGRP